MKEAMWGIGIIMMGMTSVVVVNYIGNLGTNNELDYYALREVTEAAMFDAVDLSYYRSTGRLRISSNRFVDNFSKRLTMLAGSNRRYEIQFVDIVEEPPKVSVRLISEASQRIGIIENVRFNNDIDALLLMRMAPCADDSGACEGGFKTIPEAYR